MDRVARGLVLLPPRASKVSPTYPDQRLSIDEAGRAVEQAVADLFAVHVPLWLAQCASYKAGLAQASAG
jgi:hypothetical protein